MTKGCQGVSTATISMRKQWLYKIRVLNGSDREPRHTIGKNAVNGRTGAFEVLVFQLCCYKTFFDMITTGASSYLEWVGHTS